jgi:hypothetical protein
MLTGAKQQIRMIDTQIGRLPFTDLTFTWRGEHYGCRYHGTLSPGAFEAEKIHFIQRRTREENNR